MKNRISFLNINSQNWILTLLGGTFLIIWAKSFIGNSDLNNWVLENLLVFGFLGLVVSSFKKYRLSNLSYGLIAVYLCLHVHGSMHTYANAPLGEWISQFLGSARNNFDRIVHFSFGFLLAYPIKEVLIRFVKAPKWVSWVLPAEIVLSLSGLYEIIEWAVADLFFPEQGVAYLGTQGDVWDAQKDMGLAFLGAIVMLLIVSQIKNSVFKDSGGQNAKS